MDDIAIFGAGGFGREAHQIIEDINADKAHWNFLGFLDSNPEFCEREIHGYPVLGNQTWLQDHRGTSVIVAIGHPKVRYHVVNSLLQQGHTRFATLIHPTAWVANRVEIGEGTIIHASVNVTTDIKVGSHVILNKNSTFGHDVRIESFVFVAPSAFIGGAVCVGEGCYLGASSTLVNPITIGEWSTVGAGAVVLKDLPSNVTAVGVPAKIVEHREPGWHLETNSEKVPK